MLRRSASRAAVLGVAFGGVVLGHELTYAALIPAAPVRDSVLASTGHGYLGFAAHVALAMVVVSLAGLFLGRLGERRRDPSLRELTLRLAGFQVLAFSALEVVERIGVRADLHDLVHVLPVGAVVQILVAAGAALVLRTLVRAAAVAPEILGSAAPPAAPVAIALSLSPTVPPRTRATLARRGRAPPR